MVATYTCTDGTHHSKICVEGRWGGDLEVCPERNILTPRIGNISARSDLQKENIAEYASGSGSHLYKKKSLVIFVSFLVKKLQ